MLDQTTGEPQVQLLRPMAAQAREALAELFAQRWAKTGPFDLGWLQSLIVFGAKN
jgi:hypothetical protein